MSVVIAFAISFAISALLTRRLGDPRSRLYLLDRPNDRSLHSRPMPRGGGLAIVAAIAATNALLISERGAPGALPWIGIGFLMVAAVSFLDDRAGVHPLVRLAVHVLAAGMLVHAGLHLDDTLLPGADGLGPVVPGAVAAVLFLVWMTNLYNFMDGMDGFAGGMALFGFGSLAVFGGLAGDAVFATTSIAIAAAAAGFLLFNFPPARIFMGDTGSSTLGFLAGALSLWGSRRGVLPLWSALLVFSPFAADATVTLLRRLGRGEAFWRAHKTHYYQRLVQLGWSHRRAVLLEYGVMLGCAATALGTYHAPPPFQWDALLGWAVLYAGLFGWITWRERTRRSSPDAPTTG